MGQVTPNMSIYIPAAGETNYDAAFAAGMLNIDLHDHSGAPNKGVPISGSGLAAGSVTFDKLAADVADAATGIGVPGTLGANQLTMLGILKNLYQLATATGFIAKNGSAVTARTFQDTPGRLKITNPAGVLNDPVFDIDPAFLSSRVVQTVYVEEKSLIPSLVGVIPDDTSIPQITEGDQILSATITPTDASNLLLIIVEPQIGVELVDLAMGIAIFQDATLDAIDAHQFSATANGTRIVPFIQHEMVAGTVAPTTFTVRVGLSATPPGQYFNLNGITAGLKYGGVTSSSILIYELLP